MARARIGTTVDADLLGHARRARAGMADSELIDCALAALLANDRSAEIDEAYAAANTAHPIDERDEYVVLEPGDDPIWSRSAVDLDSVESVSIAVPRRTPRHIEWSTGERDLRSTRRRHRLPMTSLRSSASMRMEVPDESGIAAVVDAVELCEDFRARGVIFPLLVGTDWTRSRPESHRVRAHDAQRVDDALAIFRDVARPDRRDRMATSSSRRSAAVGEQDGIQAGKPSGGQSEHRPLAHDPSDEYGDRSCECNAHRYGLLVLSAAHSDSETLP